MSLNKKVLSVAIFGALVTGNAFAANLSAPNGAIPAYFAKEIIASPAVPRTLQTNLNATLNWDVNYNFSANEVRYARVECTENLEFSGTTAVVLNGGGGTVGAINGMGTNVLFFSVTANAALPFIGAAQTFTLTGNHDITGTDSNVNCSVALYDLPSQAQAGGTAGLIQNSQSSGAYLAFADSYELVATSTTHTANVESLPTFSQFLVDAPVTPSITQANLANAGFSYQLKDPDGAGGQASTFGINGLPVTLANLLAGGTRILVDGDFSVTANNDGTFTGAALNNVVLAAFGPASALTASRATYNVGSAGFGGSRVEFISPTAGTANGLAIPASLYTASLSAVSAAPANYRARNISGVKLGEIVRNGVELQAPLAQVPGGWASRMVLTNTGSLPRPYAVALMGETGNVLTAGSEVTGMVPANGTIVVDVNKLLAGFTAAPRATLNVTVAGPNKQIQGLYQIVNPASGSISNHVMVRPGSN